MAFILDSNAVANWRSPDRSRRVPQQFARVGSASVANCVGFDARVFG
jgi:hypothetical protein